MLITQIIGFVSTTVVFHLQHAALSIF